MTLAYAGGSRLHGPQITEGRNIGHQVWLSGGLPVDHWGQFSYLVKWSEELNEETAKKVRELELGGRTKL